jgi:eukaryotic-like serine/threonine-protein kinase
MTDGSFGSEASFPELDPRRTFINSLIGMKIAGRYEVTRILGEGGMGVVAEGRYAELDQNVAIKFMFPELVSNEVLSARFQREAKLAARIQSPHIVRVSDVGRLPNGVPYLVMDLLVGKDLGALLDERGPLSVDRAVDYVLQACAGIAALHALGVVHRDLKPSNLFLADVSGVPTVKVLDFGISKDAMAPAAALTSTETQLGTPMYMSPEQIRASKNVDVRSDVWSLGVILYELLTGVLPFERSGHSVGELFAVILMTDPVPLRMRRAELPEALEEVVMRCLRKTSWDRHDSVAALAEALKPFARPSSLHRIDSVKRALGAPEPSSDLSPLTPLSDQPTMSAGPAIVVTPPPDSVPVPVPEPELRLEVASIPPPARAREPQASPSLVSSSRAISTGSEASGDSRRTRVVVALGLAAAVVGAAAVFAYRASLTSGASVESPATAPLPPVAASPPPPVPEPTPTPAPLPREAVVAAAVSAALAKPAASASHVSARPAHDRSVSPPVPPPAARPSAAASAPAAPPRTEDLILDRK